MSDLKAWDVLRKYQKQCDEEGIEVQVSRQAVDETLAEIERLTAENERLRLTELDSNLLAFQLTQGRWAAQTFGTQTCEEKLLHIIEEVGEIMDAPDNVTEYADVLSLLLDAARLRDISASQILFAAWEKLDVNRQRTWTLNPDGTYSGSHPQAANKRIAELEGALHDNKMRAGAGLDIPSERVDALNDIYETARDVLGE
jgi:NTP pyrophosphatase (non-canonical NTP hydrolase)